MKKKCCGVTVFLLCAVLAGCASNPGAGDNSQPRRQANRITAEEIQEGASRNAYELIRSLRPAWLETRGSHSLTNTGAGQVVVYLDGTRMGNASILTQIQIADLALAQFLSPTEAGARYGLDHTGGAILITTRRR
jgi:hypothetical protein